MFCKTFLDLCVLFCRFLAFSKANQRFKAIVVTSGAASYESSASRHQNVRPAVNKMFGQPPPKCRCLISCST